MKTMEKTKGSLLVVAGLLLLSSVGCMVTPGNNKKVASRSTPIKFEGYTVHPGQKIEIYAMTATGNWFKLGETKSSNKGFDYFGTTWYAWNRSVVIPKAYWHQIFADGAYFASVKGVADGNDLLSFEDGFYDYVGEYNSLQTLYDEKKSYHGVNVLVYALNP